MTGGGATGYGASEQNELRAVETRAADAYRRRQFDLAAGLYRLLSELEPRRADYRLHLAESLLRLGCRLMAAESFKAAAQLFHLLGLRQDAVAACRSALALRPADAGLRQLFVMLDPEGNREPMSAKPSFSLGETRIPQVTDTGSDQQVLCGRPTLQPEQQASAATGSGDLC